MTHAPDPAGPSSPAEEDGQGPAHRWWGLWVIAIIALVGLAALTGVLEFGTGTEPEPESADPATPAAPSLQGDCSAEEEASLDCRMMAAFASLDDFWSEQASELGIDYAAPGMALFAATTDRCASIPDATGPFYCPLDRAIYLDTDFLVELADEPMIEDGDLAQSYVLAHVWAHHVQEVSGLRDRVAESERESPAREQLRLEVQADCLAGAWLPERLPSARVAELVEASTLPPPAEGGEPVERWDLAETDQRVRWFEAGAAGGVDACDTFAAETL